MTPPAADPDMPGEPTPSVGPQVVPRPSATRPGEAAPWATLSPPDRCNLSLGRVLGALGAAGQRGPAPPSDDESLTPWRGVSDPAATSHRLARAAVLVALFEEQGETRVVLTRRSSELRAHRGEVAFPGGRIEPGESATDAARREAFEEVALESAHMRVGGWLHPVPTFTSGSLITPVVMVLDRRPHLVASPQEVARVFDVALAELAADGVFHEERWRVPQRPVPGSPDGFFPVWFFAVAGELVWGATARMLYELLGLVLNGGSSPAERPGVRGVGR